MKPPTNSAKPQGNEPDAPLPWPSVAVIGAGITGLTAAFRLAQKGVNVTVYEAAERVGGVIRSLRQNGYLAEFGPNSILETSPKISSLIRDLGLEPRRMYSHPRAENRYIVRAARPVCLPLSPPAFFASRLFSAPTKLRLLIEPFIPRAPADAEESVADFVLRRLGREFLDYAINPFVAGVYAGDPAQLSVKHAFPKLYAVEQRYGSLILGQILGARERKRRGEISKQDAPKLSFDEGLQVLTDTLRARLGPAVRLSSPVTALEHTAQSWIITTSLARTAAEVQSEQLGSRDAVARFRHSAVLLAAPAYQLARLELRTPAGPRSLAPLAEVYYPPVASVVLGFRRQDVAHPLDGFGMLIPKVEGFNILGTLFSSSLFSGRAPHDHVTLTSYIGGVRAPELALRRPDELVAMTLADLRAILGVTGQPTFAHQVLYPKAIPQYAVGYGRFKDLMTHLERDAPGLFFAGHYRDGISLGDSIISGHNVADRIVHYLGQPTERGDKSIPHAPIPTSSLASG